MVPALGSCLTSIVDSLVPEIGNSLASTNSQVVVLGAGVLDCLFGCVDKTQLVRAMCKTVSFGNPRVKAAMLNKLAEVVREVYMEYPSVVQKSVVPMAVHCAETEIKGEVRTSVNQLLICLNTAMKAAFMSELDALGVGPDVKERISAVVNSVAAEKKFVRR